MTRTRSETDSMGTVEVPEDVYWGAHTQRSLDHFGYDGERMPLEVMRALAVVKKCAALANHALGRLDEERMWLIVRTADEVLRGELDSQFQVRTWTSGSGTHANMNMNEVVAGRANEMAGRARGGKEPVHPNDHVNLGQSTNDAFPTAMHMAAARALAIELVPVLKDMLGALLDKAETWRDVVKIGRTHLQDAVPMTLGQEFSGYAAMIDDNVDRIYAVLPELYRVALGGTAVGTGLNAAPGFAEHAVRLIAKETELPFVQAPNLYAGMGAHDALVQAHGALRTLAVSLHKIANDIRLLGCGPRAGIGELKLPANEPGSSIMPGKVNPTMCESLTMICAQVMGNDAAIAFAGASGHLELNAYKPVMIRNVLESARLLGQGCSLFTRHVLHDLEPDRDTIDRHLNDSLMLVTALAPAIGYDKAAEIAHHAHAKGVSLKEAALALGHVTETQFRNLVDPYAMARPKK